MAAFCARDNVRILKAVALVETVYTQIRYLILEYPAAVKTPLPGDYLVRDYGSSQLVDALHNRPYSDANITGVYTNDAPEIPKDGLSREGRYVILELAKHEGYTVQNGQRIASNVAGFCILCRKGERSSWFRQDFSDMPVFQLGEVQLADGSGTVLPGALAALEKEQIEYPQLKRFSHGELITSNGVRQTYDYHIPESADGEKLPLVVYIGGARSILYSAPVQEHSSEGVAIAADPMSVSFLDMGTAILTPQLNSQNLPLLDFCTNGTFEKAMDDIMELVGQFIEQHSIDRDRVYAIGNSFGTISWSKALKNPEYAKVFTAYEQCNGNFDEAKNMFFPQFDTGKAEDKFGFHRLEDYMNVNFRQNGEEFFNSPQFETYAEILKGMADNRVAMEFWHGVNDETGGTVRAITPYLCMKEIYRRRGLSEDAINRLLQIHLFTQEQFYNQGVLYCHQATRLVAGMKEMHRRLLSLNKKDLLALR